MRKPPTDLEGLSEYAQRNLEIIRCWRLNPLQDILKAYQISKSWFFRLVQKFIQGGPPALEDRRGRPPTQKGGGSKINKQEQELIIKIKKGNPQLGSRRIEALIGSQNRFHHTTIHRLLQKEGLVHFHPYRRRTPFQMVREGEPNACWDIDFCQFWSENLHKDVYRIEIVDDCTNARLSTALSFEESSQAAAEALRQAIKEYGVPREIHSDNGLQFRAARADRPSEQFARLAEDFGISFSYSTEGRPNENGKAEHACRDFKVEFLGDDQLFALASENPLSWGRYLLSRYNVFHNWLPNQGHHLYGASPAELHPRISVTKQEALEAFEELYLKPKGMSFNTSDWQILQLSLIHI